MAKWGKLWKNGIKWNRKERRRRKKTYNLTYIQVVCSHRTIKAYEVMGSMKLLHAKWVVCAYCTLASTIWVQKMRRRACMAMTMQLMKLLPAAAAVLRNTYGWMAWYESLRLRARCRARNMWKMKIGTLRVFLLERKKRAYTAQTHIHKQKYLILYRDALNGRKRYIRTFCGNDDGSSNGGTSTTLAWLAMHTIIVVYTQKLLKQMKMCLALFILASPSRNFA